jgi:hypothetical protein
MEELLDYIEIDDLDSRQDLVDKLEDTKYDYSGFENDLARLGYLETQLPQETPDLDFPTVSNLGMDEEIDDLPFTYSNTKHHISFLDVDDIEF